MEISVFKKLRKPSVSGSTSYESTVTELKRQRDNYRGKYFQAFRVDQDKRAEMVKKDEERLNLK